MNSKYKEITGPEFIEIQIKLKKEKNVKLLSPKIEQTNQTQDGLGLCGKKIAKLEQVSVFLENKWVWTVLIYKVLFFLS